MSIREKIETIALKILSRPGMASQFREHIINEAGIGPATKVIDIATAVGGMAFVAKEKTDHVMAIDISEERIKIAKSDPRSAGINFMVMDATNTNFPDKEFDIALIVLGLHEMTVAGARKALKEAKRISKRLVVVEFGLDRWPLFWRLLRYPLSIFEPKGFLQFTRQNVEKMIDESGWTITKRTTNFPFMIYVCSS
ncbi:MAG: methyltransferase domain-containing protein [Actinobacteria bacterium]|nr:methyltransferase domain-containing protein [Actinomycetota bacterium]